MIGAPGSPLELSLGSLYFNAAPIQMIHERWTDEYSAYWAGQLTNIKYRAESRHADTKTNKKRKG